MKIYTLEKTAMAAVKSILSKSMKQNSGIREWTKRAYLYEKGLILTDGVRLLRIHDAGLEEEFSSFIQETGRVVVFSLEGNSLKYEDEVSKLDSEVGTMEKLIPTNEKFYGIASKGFTNNFTMVGKTPTAKDISKSMLNASILATNRWFDPELFEYMGARPWARVLPGVISIAFNGTNADEVFICMGTRVEGV